MTALLLLLTACAPELVGPWQGSCTFLDPAPHELAIDLDVLRVRGGDVEGIGSFVLPTPDRDWTFEGNLVGAQTDEDVMIRLEGVAGGYVMTLRMDGALRHQKIKGDCTVDDQNPDVVGELAIAPVE